jgi:hypothetical protein
MHYRLALAELCFLSLLCVRMESGGGTVNLTEVAASGAALSTKITEAWELALLQLPLKSQISAAL